MPTSSAGSRLHVVLVPGFAGFDALGQLEYYAGVTPLFRKWRGGHPEARVALHYFDNFPTAAVATRAYRLERYLAKRLARGEFAPDDRLALVGHSTGGLDIRRLLWNLAADREPIAVDGGETVQAGDILGLIRRVVFLSVPQWGTNIAHWVRENLLARAAVVAQLRTSVAASQVPVLGTLQGWVGRLAAEGADSDLLRAFQDALGEADARPGASRAETAAAHEAAAELELWLRHMANDFSAIDDLTPASTPPSGSSGSPAHFSALERAEETARWRGISTKSYATISPRPFRFESGKPAPAWDLLKPWTWPALTPAADGSAGTDLAYRYCYRACAGGPFPSKDFTRWPRLAPLGKPEPRTIEPWDNDGIVNTASMLWPNGDATVLVECDHMDIVGHYDGERRRKRPRAYDLLRSASGFTGADFEAVWNDVFEFCALPAADAAGIT